MRSSIRNHWTVPAIRILPTHTVNRIAAGEVIERPGAAVKELVENALDAHPTRIAVALENGGIDRIEVTDDGEGMAANELALAVLRHATSKLADDNLAAIATLGFRGEALPSIGAAARLSITSRPRGADHASSISVEGGEVSAVAPAAGGFGTRVVVRDLFFATPARRKFLKHPRTESDHAEAAVRRLAMAAPGVAFRLESDGRAVFDLPAQDRAARVAALLGPEAAAVLLPIDAERGVLRLSGFACAPSVTRATSATQALTVNGRPVMDTILKGALRVAYRHVIAAGRHPVAALYLDLPPHEVDVNVHPAKTELRFRDSASVRGLVIGALGRALSGGAGTGVPVPALAHRPALLHLAPPRPSQGGIRALPLPGFASSPTAGPAFAEAQLPLHAPPAARLLPAPTPQAEHPLGAPVAQVLDTYIIAIAADGSLVLVDQHAAHERLTHEALRAQMLDGGVRRQPLLLPAVVEMAPSDVSRLLNRIAELERLGLELEAFGPGAVLVRALPAALGASEPAPLLRDLADELAELEEATALAVRLDAVIARMACHGSIRAGRRLAPAEMDALLRQMEATPRASTCSHGRPTVLKLSKAEIEALFRRR
ncbi:MAG: DNA mismatch repair endonuclease MutL [Acetobacteraceae bacterium]|nr:DNA mismatch repair endonuclease MutL [Acetobacteraceae bacterium]